MKKTQLLFSSMKHRTLTLLCFFFLTGNIFGQLNGSYTIGANGTEDYSSFGDAIAALSSNGVSGHCYFMVSSGTYEEQLSISEITGVSESARIYFSSASEELDDVFVTYNLQDVEINGLVDLDGADYIYFHNINFEVAAGSAYGIIFNFRNGASHNDISYNHLTGIENPGSAGVYSLIYSKDAGATIDEYNTIKGNTLLYGSFGIYFSGIDASDLEKGNEISNNDLLYQYKTGINLTFQDSCTIKNDSIVINSSLENPVGVYVNGSKQEIIFNNSVTIATTSATPAGHGIYIHDGTGASDERGNIFNNFINLTTNSEIGSYALFIRNSPYRNIYSNTINITGLNNNSVALYVFETTSEYFDSRNNILANQADGYAFVNSVTGDFTSDYNAFYTSGPTLIFGYASFEDWQTTTSEDQNSLVTEPQFVSVGDPHIYHAFADLDGTGNISLTGNSQVDYYLQRDIDNEVRDGSSPDIGADEYTYISNENDFLTYSFEEQTGDALINADDHDISVEVEYGTDLTSLVATFTASENATVAIGPVLQESDVTANDFTSPVVYTITAEDGTEQDWTVTVAGELNDSTEILSYSLAEQTGAADINATDHIVQIEVAFSADITNLAATFILSTGASATVDGINQTSGVTHNDFTSPVVYTVTAEDGAEQEWTITVTRAENTENDILGFSFAEQTEEAVIDDVNHTVDIEVTNGTDITNLVATFTISEEASASIDAVIQESGVTGNDFSAPVPYTITAQNGDQQEWMVRVTVENPDGLEEADNIDLVLFPNPAAGFIHITCNRNISNVKVIELMDNAGNTVATYNAYPDNDQTITLYLDDGYAAGLYFIRIVTSEHIYTHPVIVK